MLDEALIDRRRVPLSKRCTKKNQGGSLKKNCYTEKNADDDKKVLERCFSLLALLGMKRKLHAHNFYTQSF